MRTMKLNQYSIWLFGGKEGAIQWACGRECLPHPSECRAVQDQGLHCLSLQGHPWDLLASQHNVCRAAPRSGHHC